jgi:aminopeptidase N
MMMCIVGNQCYQRDEERKVTIKYTVTDPVSGMMFSYPDQAYPNRPVFAISDNETERCTHTHQPIHCNQ